MNELDRLTDLIDIPVVDIADDVRRGRRALRRRTALVAAAGSVATLSVIGGAVWVGARPGAHTVTDPSGFAGGGPAGPTSAATAPRHPTAHRTPLGFPTMSAADEQRLRTALTDWRAVIAEHVDPSGTLLGRLSGFTGSDTAFGSKLDWNGGGMLQFSVGSSFADLAGVADVPMRPNTTHAGMPALIEVTTDRILVELKRSDGTVVALLASTAFGNNGTSASLGPLSEKQLLAAASDPRMQRLVPAPQGMPTGTLF
ncbi:hypothetical protein [Nocardioides ultimimeridianus]